MSTHNQGRHWWSGKSTKVHILIEYSYNSLLKNKYYYHKYGKYIKRIMI